MNLFIDSQADLVPQGDRLVITRHQEIPSEFLAGLAEERTRTRLRPGQEVNRVAAVPAVIVDQWMRQGFDIFRESNKAIVARLKAEHLDHFVTARGV
jgi:hypothetical protein